MLVNLLVAILCFFGSHLHAITVNDLVGKPIQTFTRDSNFKVHQFDDLQIAFITRYAYQFFATVRNQTIADAFVIPDLHNNFSYECELKGDGTLKFGRKGHLVALFKMGNAIEKPNIAWRIDKKTGRMAKMSDKDVKSLTCKNEPEPDHSTDD